MCAGFEHILIKCCYERYLRMERAQMQRPPRHGWAASPHHELVNFEAKEMLTIECSVKYQKRHCDHSRELGAGPAADAASTSVIPSTPAATTAVPAIAGRPLGCPPTACAPPAPPAAAPACRGVDAAAPSTESTPWKRSPQARSAATSSARSASLCAADRLTRSRLVPRGTVGGRIAGTCSPRCSSAMLASTAACSGPMMRGTMGLETGTSSSWPSRRASCHTRSRRQGSCRAGGAWAGRQAGARSAGQPTARKLRRPGAHRTQPCPVHIVPQMGQCRSLLRAAPVPPLAAPHAPPPPRALAGRWRRPARARGSAAAASSGGCRPQSLPGSQTPCCRRGRGRPRRLPELALLHTVGDAGMHARGDVSGNSWALSASQRPNAPSHPPPHH